jgi:hypothetical protein
MTPKEKAEELVEKMYVKYEPKIEDKGGIYYFNMSFDIAKQCAIIAVDEIIEALSFHSWQNRNEIEYYEEIKHEIQKL